MLAKAREQVDRASQHAGHLRRRARARSNGSCAMSRHCRNRTRARCSATGAVAMPRRISRRPIRSAGQSVVRCEINGFAVLSGDRLGGSLVVFQALHDRKAHLRPERMLLAEFLDQGERVLDDRIFFHCCWPGQQQSVGQAQCRWVLHDVVRAQGAGRSRRKLDPDHARQERNQWDGRPHPITASMCQSGSVIDHSNRKGRPPCRLRQLASIWPRMCFRFTV